MEYKREMRAALTSSGVTLLTVGLAVEDRVGLAIAGAILLGAMLVWIGFDMVRSWEPGFVTVIGPRSKRWRFWSRDSS